MGAKKGSKRPDMRGNKYAIGNNGGRPTKMTPELLEKAAGYIKWCEDNPIVCKHILNQATGEMIPAEKKPRCPTIAGLASYLGIGKQTLVNWTQDNKEFLSVLEDLKAEAESMMEQNGLVGVFNPLMSKFLLSSDYGKVEKNEVKQEIEIHGISDEERKALKDIL